MNIKQRLEDKNIDFHLVMLIAAGIGVIVLVLFFLNIYTNHGRAKAVPDFTGKTVVQASQIASSLKLEVEIIDSTFDAAFVPGTILNQSPAKGSFVKKGRKIYVTIASFSPEKLKMPKLTDISLRQALTVIENSGFEIGKINYQPSEFFNLVLQQKCKGVVISPDSFLTKGSAIDLIVGMGLSSEKVTIPNLQGLSIFEARESLLGIYVSLGAIMYDNSCGTNLDSLNAMIWKQSPESNRQIEMGSTVDIWLSCDSSKFMPLIEDLEMTDSLSIDQTETDTLN